jgi:hypothetical protein
MGTVNTGGRNIIGYSWDFGDGNIDVTQNSVHLYQAANSYTVKYSVITDIGCFSDTVQQTVPISLPPVADFAVSTPACENKILNFTDQSSASSGPPITKWTWNFGDGSPQVISTNRGNNLMLTITRIRSCDFVGRNSFRVQELFVFSTGYRWSISGCQFWPSGKLSQRPVLFIY